MKTTAKQTQPKPPPGLFIIHSLAGDYCKGMGALTLCLETPPLTPKSKMHDDEFWQQRFLWRNPTSNTNKCLDRASLTDRRDSPPAGRGGPRRARSAARRGWSAPGRAAARASAPPTSSLRTPCVNISDARIVHGIHCPRYTRPWMSHVSLLIPTIFFLKNIQAKTKHTMHTTRRTGW